MVEICEVDIPRHKFLECPPCFEIFFKRISRVSFPSIPRVGPIVIIRRYVLRKCFLGLAIGPHVYSLTLLPGEQLEIEIVRRSKFSRALHEQRSVESEFRFELQSTTRDEWSSEQESNFKITAEEDFSIFGIGVESTQEYSSREKTAEEHFREVVAKTSSRVSRKFEIAIDTKTEVENQYRSLRKIANPNACQPVMYNYFQLAKKYKTELILVDLRFDIPRQPPLILTSPLAAASLAAESPYRQNVNLNVVAAPPPWTLASAAGTGPGAASVAFSAPFTSVAALPGAVSAAFTPASIAAFPSVRAPIDPPEVLELTRDEIIARVKAVDPSVVEAFTRELDELLQDERHKRGVKDKYEYCVNTDGVYVEANVSKCSACDEATVELRRIEVEKAKLELEQKKREMKK